MAEISFSAPILSARGLRPSGCSGAQQSTVLPGFNCLREVHRWLALNRQYCRRERPEVRAAQVAKVKRGRRKHETDVRLRKSFRGLTADFGRKAACDFRGTESLETAHSLLPISTARRPPAGEDCFQSYCISFCGCLSSLWAGVLWPFHRHDRTTDAKLGIPSSLSEPASG